MKLYLLSLGAGLLVGVLYSLLNVRSPAPPFIALVGLLGILVGEQILPLGKHFLERHVQTVTKLSATVPDRSHAQFRGDISREQNQSAAEDTSHEHT